MFIARRVGSIAGPCFAVFMTIVLSPLPAETQTVELRRGNRGLPLADQIIRRVLRRGRYQVFTRDTILASEEVVSGDIVLLGATLRVEGAIEGDLIAVESDVFTRPGARIAGEVVILNGGFYGSALADMRSPAIDGGLYDYRVDRAAADRYIIVAPGGGAAVNLPGVNGFLFPLYDRVNAVTIAWGVDFDRGAASWLPNAEARLRLRSARGKLDGDLKLEWPFGRHTLTLRGGREVRSNDAWIENDIENTASGLILGADYRDYFDAKFIAGGLRLEHGTRFVWSFRTAAAFERARSLENKDPFSIFNYRGGFRGNPPIDDGDITDFEIDLGFQTLARPFSRLALSLGFEASDRSYSDFTYYFLSGDLELQIPVTGSQNLELYAKGRLPTTDVPQQRWLALGGWRTLPTLRRLERRGDHFWWIGAEYLFGTGRRLGPLGELLPYVSYASGNAWERGTARPPTVHNLGLGINFGVIGLGVYTDPGDDFDTVVAIGIARRR